MDGSVMNNIGNGLGNRKTRKKLVALFAIKIFDISAMGSSALDLRVSGKKHQQLMLERSKSGVIDLMFNKPCS